ncbi:MAG: PAS domain S-box protein [Xanthomonadales bacterium]|nr:PAS domain S-box protein [Xanthomonadales bacterium]
MRENTQLSQVTWDLMSRTGQAFFSSMVEHLATMLGLRVAFIVESMDMKGERVAPLASFGVQGFREECAYNTRGTPCERLAGGAAGIYPNNLLDHFPNDAWLQKTDMQAYVAIPLLDKHGHVLGHMGVLDDREIENSDKIIELLESFAQRVRAEITRKKLDAEQNTTLQKLHESEQQFDTLFQNTFCGMVFVNPETAQIIECNQRICEMLGYSRGELKKLSVRDIHREEDLPRLTKEFESLVNHKPSRDMAFLMKRKDGSLFDASITNFWIRYHGKDCLAAAFFDVTGNKKIEQALRIEKEKFANYLENAAVMTLVLDEQGTVLLINRMGCDVLGRPVEAILGRNWFERFLPVRLRKEVGRVHSNMMAGDIEPASLFENPVINAQGEERLISWRNSVLRNQQGKIIATLSSGEDITDERHAELALESARQRLQFVVKNAPAIIFVCEAREPYNISYLTDNAMEQLGYEPAQMQERSGFWSELTHPDDLDDVISAISLFLEQGYIQTEMRIRLRDGSYRWYQNNMKLIRDNQDKPLEIFGYLMDIHRTKEAELALQERRVRLSYAQKLTHMGSWERDLESGEESWSNEIYRIFGYAPHAIEASEQRMLKSIHPDDRQLFQSSISQGLVTREQFDFEFRVRRSKADVRFVLALNEVVRDRQGKAVQLLGTLQDITERRESELQLRHSHEKLRRLADHIQSARENERTSIAREIHDEMAQSLTAQKIDLVRLKSKLPNDDAYLTGLSEDILKSVNQTIASVQRILTELRPALLDDLGLLAAIEWQVEQFQKRAQINCHLVLPDEEPELSPKERTALFRVMQEALSNILRHSNATEMRLELIVEEPWLLMNISDNGKGVSDIEVLGSKSFGLMGMRERAHVFGGDVNIVGEDGKGTTVSTKIPLKRKMRSEVN